jgi:hypothetical protein
LINSNLWQSIWQAGHSNNNEQTSPQVCKPASSVHIVPQVQNSPLSTSKFVNADYIAIYYKAEVNFYNVKTTKSTVSEEAVLKGWQYQAAGLWQLSLV